MHLPHLTCGKCIDIYYYLLLLHKFTFVTWNMEWRIFLPQVDSCAPLSKQEEQYLKCLNELERAMELPEHSETRTDIYYVCEDHVGIKSRAGKRLEVKLRTSQVASIPGTEVWKKYKLGKGDAQEHLDDIYALLSNANLPCSEKTIDTTRLVAIEKTRFQSSSFFGSKELTYLRPLHKEISVTSWISICIEEESESSLLTAVQALPLPLISRCIDACLQMRHSPAPSFAHFFPLIAGYPTWIHALAQPTHADSPEILLPILQFFQCAEYTPRMRLPASILSSTAHPLFHPQQPSPTPQTAYDFSFYPILCTRRLVLRRVMPSDVSSVMEFRGNYEVTKYNQGAAYTSVAQAENLIRSMDEEYEAKTALRWGITLTGEHAAEMGADISVKADEVVGMVGFNYWNRTDHRGSIGLELLRSLWGNGYMQESLTAVLSFGFNEMHLNRIEAAVSAHNDRSLKMLTKIGFVQEGLQREQYYEDGSYHDLILLAILKREWAR